MAEQTLKALGVTKCSDLTASRGLLGALYSGIATDHFMAVSLGIGGTRHSDPVKEGEAGRKGMSCERTFRAISSRSDLEAKVRSTMQPACCAAGRMASPVMLPC